MFYTTYRKEQTPNIDTRKYSFIELLKQSYINTPIFVPNRFMTLTSDEIVNRAQNETRAAYLEKIIEKIVEEYPDTSDMSSHYTTFKIPKHAGGMRTINAPDAILKRNLAIIKDVCEAINVFSHDCAYAYVKERNTHQAIKLHQNRAFKWYMRLDMHDFFGSCNKDFIKKQLKQIPIFFLLSDEVLEKLLDICMLNGGLPQGTPLSPWLTNQIMIPIDYTIDKWCRKHNIVYTRYADDMLFSANSRSFLETETQQFVTNLISSTPLTLNAEKTKITSINGQNFQLGLIVNQDNNITVGHRRKERFRATLMDFGTNKTNWTTQECMEFLGLIQYYLSIEPEYFQKILEKYNLKFNTDIRLDLIEKIK